jgi:ankyrin repeat protein
LIYDPYDDLLLALTNEDDRGVEHVLKNNDIDINYADGHLVAVAVAWGNLDVLKLLESYGADLKKDKFLSSSCQYGALDVVKFLASRGADLTHDDNYPLNIAVMYEQFDVLRYLIESGVPPVFDIYLHTELTILRYNNLSMLEYMKDVGFDFSVFDDTYENLIERNKKKAIKEVLTN